VMPDGTIAGTSGNCVSSNFSTNTMRVRPAVWIRRPDIDSPSIPSEPQWPIRPDLGNEPAPGQVGSAPTLIPASLFPELPTAGGILNPTQMQLDNAGVGDVFRYDFNGTVNTGTGMIRTITLPVGQTWRMETWGASQRISANVAADTELGVAWGSFARGEITIHSQNTFHLMVGQMGRRVWQNAHGNATGASNGSFGNGGTANLHTSVPTGNSSAQGAGMTAIFATQNNVNNVIIAGGGAGGVNNDMAAVNAQGRAAVTQFPMTGSPITGGNPSGSLIGQGAHAANTGGRRTSGGAGFPGGNSGGNATNGLGGHAFVRTSTGPTWVGISEISHRLTNAYTSQRDGVDTTVNDFNGMIRLTRID